MITKRATEQGHDDHNPVNRDQKQLLEANLGQRTQINPAELTLAELADSEASIRLEKKNAKLSNLFSTCAQKAFDDVATFQKIQADYGVTYSDPSKMKADFARLKAEFAEIREARQTATRKNGSRVYNASKVSRREHAERANVAAGLYEIRQAVSSFRMDTTRHNPETRIDTSPPRLGALGMGSIPRK